MFQVRRTIHTLLLAALLTPFAGHAAVLEGFYQITVPAREGLERSEALREAAQLMITRQAGSGAIDNDALRVAIQDPSTLMSRIAGTEAGGVQVNFEPAALRDLLGEAGLSMLGPNRPTVMLWATEDGPVGLELLGQGSEWAAILDNAAAHRAVALSLPLADLEDRMLVDVATIAEADEATLRRASERYDASAVLALSIDEGADKAILEWSWWLNDQTKGGRISADTKAAAADELMLRVADLVIEQYAVTPTSAVESSDWQIVVEGIDSVGEFAAMQRTLQQLGSKKAPRVLSVKGDEVRLALEFPGSEAQLERLLALDQRMRRMPAPEPEPQPQIESERLTEQPITESDEAGVDQALPGDGEGTDDAPGARLKVAGSMVDSAAVPEPVAAANILFYRWR